MAMNGTESQVSFLSSAKNITDTEAILDLMDVYKLELSTLLYFHSIFVGFKNAVPFIVANNIHDIELYRNAKKGAMIFASSFPPQIKKNVYIPVKKFFLYKNSIKMENFRKKVTLGNNDFTYNRQTALSNSRLEPLYKYDYNNYIKYGFNRKRR